MRPKTFKIIYMLDGKTMNTQCSIYYLHKYIDKLIEDGSRIICIFANNVKSNKPLDSNVEEKNKYYNSRYNYYYRQYKSNKIDEDMFNGIKIKLKELKEKWKRPIQNWRTIQQQLIELFGDRYTKYLIV